MSNIGLPEILLIFCVVVIFAVVFLLVPYWRIFGKAGFPPALSLLMIVPLVNLVMIYYLAFAEWPGLKQGQK